MSTLHNAPLIQHLHRLVSPKVSAAEKRTKDELITWRCLSALLVAEDDDRKSMVEWHRLMRQHDGDAQSLARKYPHLARRVLARHQRMIRMSSGDCDDPRWHDRFELNRIGAIEVRYVNESGLPSKIYCLDYELKPFNRPLTKGRNQ